MKTFTKFLLISAMISIFCTGCEERIHCTGIIEKVTARMRRAA